MVKYVFFMFCFFSISLSAQSFADRNKKTLITALPKEKDTFTFDISATSANFLYRIGPNFLDAKYTLKKDKGAYISNPADSTFWTAKDRSFFFITLGVKDVNKSYDEFLTDLNQPTVELGVSFAFNSVYWVNWNKLDQYWSPIKQWDFYAKLFVNNTFSDYYDRINDSETARSKWPLVNYGTQLDFIAYRRRLWFPITFTLSKGMIVENLKPYSDVPSTVDPETTRYDIGKPIGKYGGALDRQQWNSRGSFTMLYFLGDNSNKGWMGRNFSRLCLLPNYSTYGAFDKEWFHVAGASVGLLKEKYDTKKNNSLDIKPLLQFGVDWQSDPISHTWSKPYWIFSFKGTIK